MTNYRKLTSGEIAALKAQACFATDWDAIEVDEDFKAKYVRHCRFSGKIRMGKFEKEFSLPGGMMKHTGIYYACTMLQSAMTAALSMLIIISRIMSSVTIPSLLMSTSS